MITGNNQLSEVTGNNSLGFLNQEDGVNTSIVLRVIGYLGILCPNNLSRLCYQTQLTNVNLNDRSLCNNSKGGVHGRWGVLLHS